MEEIRQLLLIYPRMDYCSDWIWMACWKWLIASLCHTHWTKMNEQASWLVSRLDWLADWFMIMIVFFFFCSALPEYDAAVDERSAIRWQRCWVLSINNTRSFFLADTGGIFGSSAGQTTERRCCDCTWLVTPFSFFSFIFTLWGGVTIHRTVITMMLTRGCYDFIEQMYPRQLEAMRLSGPSGWRLPSSMLTKEGNSTRKGWCPLYPFLQ